MHLQFVQYSPTPLIRHEIMRDFCDEFRWVNGGYPGDSDELSGGGLVKKEFELSGANCKESKTTCVDHAISFQHSIPEKVLTHQMKGLLESDLISQSACKYVCILTEEKRKCVYFCCKNDQEITM